MLSPYKMPVSMAARSIHPPHVSYMANRENHVERLEIFEKQLQLCAMLFSLPRASSNR